MSVYYDQDSFLGLFCSEILDDSQPFLSSSCFFIFQGTILFLNSERMIHCMGHHWHSIFFLPFDTHAPGVFVCLWWFEFGVGRLEWGDGGSSMLLCKTIHGCCKIRICSNVYLSDAKC